MLRLYVGGMTPNSLRAIENIRNICAEHLEGRHQLEIVDIYQQPELAKEKQIIVTPTLIMELPLPGRRIIGDMTGFLKLLFRRDDMKLLGVHVIGQQAAEVVHVGLMAMLTGATAEIFDEACFNEPTLDALYKFAALEAILKITDSRHINLPAI